MNKRENKQKHDIIENKNNLDMISTMLSHIYVKITTGQIKGTPLAYLFVK